MSDRPLDSDVLRYQRYWEPVLAPAAQRLLERIIEPPNVLLDVGAGTGSLTLAAAARWPEARLIVLDASGAMLRVARERAAESPSGDTERFSWLSADARDMPLADDTVDAAVSSFVLQTVDDRSRLLGEVRRVLRPGGVFAFVTWLADDIRMAADEAYDDVLRELGLAANGAPLRSPRAGDYTSIDEARTELRAVGFTYVEVWNDTLHARWTPEAYLDFKERYDDHERFEELDEPAREQLRSRLLVAWADLPESAFEVRSPLVGGLGRAPSASETHGY